MAYTPEDYGTLPHEVVEQLPETLFSQTPLIQTAIVHGLLMIPMDADHRLRLAELEEEMADMSLREQQAAWRELFAKARGRTQAFLRRTEPRAEATE